jgi:calmodulin
LIFKYLNQEHKEDEIKQLIADIDPDSSGSMDFPSLVLLMTKKSRDNDTYEELLEVNNR